MRMTVRAIFVAGLCAAAMGCNCGDDRFKRVSDTQITIEAPEDEATVFSGQPVTFRAVATNVAGLKSLALRVGANELKSCEPVAGEEHTVLCEGEFWTKDQADQIAEEDSTLKLTAHVVDQSDLEADKTIVVHVKPLRIVFRQPTLTQRNPPLAVLRGSGTLELDVQSSIPVQRVQVIVDDDNSKIVSGWTAEPYKRENIAWASVVGTGEHKLVALARDIQGNVDTTILQVRVACTGDGDCAEGNRCCVDDGQCHPMVGRGAECDCAHPCPVDQGCFPGVCGELPRKCRPGCYPGDRNVKADRCAAQDGKTSFCAVLPPEERTDENRGGACAVADTCDVVAQNCPDLPVDRSQPTSQRVAHSCIPVSPVANACMPAGRIPLGGINCAYDTCGDTTKACQRGLLCTTPIDQNGNVVGPNSCSKQCRDPGSFSSSDCGAGYVCNPVQGAGGELFKTGICRKF